MKYKYLSHLISEATPMYGGYENLINIKKSRSIQDGDTSNNLTLEFPNHIGTHIDFPFHFSMNGNKLQDYSAEFWIFNNIGFIQTEFSKIEKNLDNLSKDIEFLIIKTGFEDFRGQKKYWSEQPIISSKIAKILKERFKYLRVIGFDMISLTSQLDKEEGIKAHNEFLIHNDLLVVEDMALKNLNICPNKLFVMPLMIKDSDGSPCTIIAEINE